MKKVVAFIIALLVLSPASRLHAQDRDVKYMTSEGKRHPLQAIMDIRHYTLVLDVDIQQETITG